MQPAKPHLSVVPDRSPQSELRSFRSWLGKQAAIGGRPHLKRLIKSDEFTVRFSRHTGETRLQALDCVTRTLEKAAPEPTPYKPPRHDSRVKTKWTPAKAARFTALAPRFSCNKQLAVELGLSPLCAGSIRRRRYTEFGPVSATVKAGPMRAPPVAALPLAA